MQSEDDKWDGWDQRAIVWSSKRNFPNDMRRNIRIVAQDFITAMIKETPCILLTERRFRRIMNDAELQKIARKVLKYALCRAIIKSINRYSSP